MTITCDKPRPKLKQPNTTNYRPAWAPPAFIPPTLDGMQRTLRDALQGIYDELCRVGAEGSLVPLLDETINALSGQTLVGVADGQTVVLPQDEGTVDLIVEDVANPVTVVFPDGTTATIDTPGLWHYGSGDGTSYVGDPWVTVLGGIVAGITSDRLLGRDTAGTGAVEEISLTAPLEFTGALAVRIATNGIGNTLLAQVTPPTLKGRTTSGVGNLEDLTLTNSTSITWVTSVGGAISMQRPALTGAIAAAANSNATVFAGIRLNGVAQSDRSNLNLISTTNVGFTVTDDAANDELEIRGTVSLGWDDVLAVDNNSGTNNPHIDSGQFLGFGAEGSLPAAGQIRASGALDMRITADALVNAGGGASIYAGGTPVTAVADGAVVLNATVGTSIKTGSTSTTSVSTNDVAIQAEAGGVAIDANFAAQANPATGDILLNATSGVRIHQGATQATTAVGLQLSSDSSVAITPATSFAVTAGGAATLDADTWSIETAGVERFAVIDAQSTFSNVLITNGSLAVDADLRIRAITANASTGSVNNLAIGSVGVVRFTGPPALLTGMNAVANQQTVLLVNAGATGMPISTESASSTASNRFADIDGFTSPEVPAGGFALAWYDATSARWRLCHLGGVTAAAV